MVLFLFLITIFCVPIITAAQPFIDCSGKSFLCENTTHFTICVDVGGGVSMTVGNIVLSCPPTTFCDENNAFECEYHTTPTTPNSISQGTDIPTETTVTTETTETIEARLTTNVYDEFLFTSDSQQAEENNVIPTQQKYIIPGNANVIFDDTDNAVLVYGNYDSETVNSTPANEKVTKNINITKVEYINNLKNKTSDMKNKFTRNKEPTPKIEETPHEKSTTIEKTTTDKMMTTFSELTSDSVTTEESFAVKYLTTKKNILVTQQRSDLSSTAKTTSSLENNSENITTNYKNFELTTISNWNKQVDNNLSLKIRENVPVNAIVSNSTLSDCCQTVNNASTPVNITHKGEILTNKLKETLQQNKGNKKPSKNTTYKVNEDSRAIHSTTVMFAKSTDITLETNISTDSFIQNHTYLKDVSISFAYLNRKNSTTPGEGIGSSLKIPKISSKVVTLNSTGYFNKTKSTTPKMRPENYAQNATISNSTVHLFKAMTKTANKSVPSNSSSSTKKYTENSTLSKDITPLHSSGQQIKTGSKLPNKTVTSILSTPSTRFVQNASFRKDVLSSSSAHPIKTKSTTTTLRNDNLRNIESTILLKDVHPTTVKNITPYFSTTTKTYILSDIMSNPIIPPESAEFDITFGDILKESTVLKTPKQIYLTEKAILNSTIKPDYLSLNNFRYTIHDNDLRKNIGGKSADSITDKQFHLRNENTKMANINDKLSKDGITAKIITDKRTSRTSIGKEYLNNILHTNAETITEFPIQNLITLQQTNSYQTTSKSIDLGDIKNTLIEEPDHSVFFFPATPVETLVTELSTTSQTYIQNNIISNPIVPNEFPEFDISFRDLIKESKDFIELKSPLQISFTDRPNLDFTRKTVNRESLRNFRSALHNNSSNYEVYINSTDKNTHNMSLTNVTGSHETNVKNETVIEASESFNKDLLLNNTNTLNFTLQNLNTNNQNSGKRKEIIEKIQDIDKILSPIYNLTYNSNNHSNHMLNMTTVPSADKGHTIRYNDSATSLTVNENLKTDKPISNVLLKNIEEEDSKYVNDENIDHLEITNDTYNTDKRKNNKLIKRIDSELLNDTLNVLNYSTPSPLETSNYSINTEGITISYDQNRTIASLKNNTADIENQPHKVKNIEHENNSRLYSTENTERTLHPPTTISNESIFNDTFGDMIKNNQTALPNSSINSEGQTTDLTVSTHYHKDLIVNSSLMIINRQNRQEKPLLEEVKGIENPKEFTSNIPTIVTQLTSHKSTLRTNSIIDDKANGTFVSSTEHIIADYSTPILTTTQTTTTTESVRLTTKSKNGHLTSRSLSNNIETSATEMPIYESYNKALSNKGHYQNTFYDAFVNSIIKDQNPTLQVSRSTNKNEQQTTSSLENTEENVTKGETGQVNNYATTISSGKLLNATHSSKYENSTIFVLNETKTNISTSKVFFNDHDSYGTLHIYEIDINTPANISNELINKLEQENINSKSNFNLSHQKLIGREDLDITGHNDTTKSSDKIAKAQEEISVDKVTGQSEHNIKNLTTLSKNEAFLQKCSNKTVCINQANGQVSIEFYNKTNSKIKEMRVRDNRNLSNTTINTPKTELGTENKLVMQTEKYNDNITSLIPTQVNTSEIGKANVSKSSMILQYSKLQSQEYSSKTNVESPKSAVTFYCRNHSRGRYSDKDNCRKFYICISYSTPIVGFCPENTVFSEFKKQCTNNLSHCIRNNQFKCVKDGRFLDVWQDNMYYLCIKGPKHRFLRLKLQCKRGYILDKLNMMCKQGKKVTKLSSSTSSNSSSSSSSSDKKKHKIYKKSPNDKRFKCNEEGLFVDPNNCRKYYICSKTSKSVMRRKRKKCDSDEVFDDDKKKCVDEDSYECK